MVEESRYQESGFFSFKEELARPLLIQYYIKMKRKNYVGSESHSPHLLSKRSHFGTDYRKAPPPQKGKEKSMGIKRAAGLARNRLLMRVDNNIGKGTFGMDKFSSEVHRAISHNKVSCKCVCVCALQHGAVHDGELRRGGYCQSAQRFIPI